MERVILFDGDCHFCSRSVQFIMKRDPKACFKFAPLQSDIGKKLMNKYGLVEDTDSLVLLENNHCYIKSSAALRICRNLKGTWKLASIFLLVPKFLRDPFYETIAKNRYRFFRNKERCILPTLEERKRFL